MGFRVQRVQRRLCLCWFAIVIVAFCNTVRAETPLPTSWTSADIGAVGQPGSAMFNTPDRTDWTVSGAGADIWGTHDAFHYLYRPLRGPGFVQVRVVTIQNTDAFAKAGLMMRESLAADSKHVLLDVKPNGTWEFLTRSETGGPTTATGGSGAGMPMQLMLLRVGDQIAARIEFGDGWHEVGLVSLPMTPTLYIGLAVTSHDVMTTNSSRFDHLHAANLEDEGPPQPWVDQDIGETGLRGSTFNAGLDSIYLNGAGADIWGSADAFRYVSQPIDGDADIIAQVRNIENTHPFAKAGLMLRQSLTPDSPHVILDVKPDGGIEFMTRSANGEATSFIAGGSAPLPVWLRLTRAGATIAGAFSVDGVSWTEVGSITTPISESAHIGMAVTSHDPSKTAFATFEFVGMAGGVRPPEADDDDIVWYAADARPEDLHGQWISVCCDSGSPDGVRLASPDAGFAALEEPLASPEHYIDVPFEAVADTPHTLWLRASAANNSKWNDSVWVQFSGALVNGAPAYQTGTTSGLLLNLATDSGASSLNAWGWANGAYWLSQPATVTFATSGPQALRIQVREDGVAFDQIVLSSGRYLTAPPGPATNDHTIVPQD